MTNNLNTIVLASNNQGKMFELQSLLDEENLGVTVMNQKKMGIDDALETGLSFIENAIIKARHASHQSGLPAIADDSGLCVPILNNAPGIFSARFADLKDTTNKDSANNNKLQQLLLPCHQQGQVVTAFFVCVLVFLRTSDDPLPVIAEGYWHGQIIATPKGEQGFGYDPLFFVPTLGKTAAELDSATKNALSHRGQAMRTLVKRLKEGVWVECCCQLDSKITETR